jgi:hypothetical protein
MNSGLQRRSEKPLSARTYVTLANGSGGRLLVLIGPRLGDEWVPLGTVCIEEGNGAVLIAVYALTDRTTQHRLFL